MESKQTLIKFLIWTGVVIATSLMFWHYCQDLYLQATLNVATGPIGIISFALALSLLALGMIIFKDFNQSAILASILPITYLYVFGFEPEITISALIFIVLAFFGWSLARSDIKESLKIHTARTSRLILWPVVVGLSLMISVASIGSLSVQDVAEAPIATQNEISSLVQKFAPTEFNSLNQKQRADILSEISKRVNLMIGQFMDASYEFLPQAFAVALFLVLIGLSWAAVFGIGFLSAFLFFIFKKTGLISIQKIQTEAERIVV